MLRLLLILPVLMLFACNSSTEAPKSPTTAAAKDTIPKADSVQTADFYAKPEGVTFSVSNVQLPKNLLKTEDAQIVFERKIEKKIKFFPQKFKGKQLVSCYNNGLIETIQQSYDQHRPLILSPDHIWLAICQGVSIHINEKFDSLQHVIFVKNKPKELVCRNDSLATSGKSWEMLVASLSDQTQKYTKGDYYSFFVSDFSTTTEVEKTAYQITLLESYKKAFTYVGESGCGIPSITLSGTKKDWEKILAKLPMLKKIGLGDWAKSLDPVIREFIGTYDGKVNKPFWQSIYKDASEYGAFYISGWIIKFFPYLKTLDHENSVFDSKRGEMRVEEHYKKNTFLQGDDYLMSTLSTDDFPTGMSKIEVKFNNYFNHTTEQIEVYSGFFGIKQYDDKTIEPVIGWAVCEKKAKSPTYKTSGRDPEQLKHNFVGWSPQVVKDNPPIYDVKKFKTASESMKFLKQYIQDSIASAKRFMDVKLVGQAVEFVVLSNGNTTDFKLTGKGDPQLLAYIERLIKRLPKEWLPAMAKFSDMTEDYDETNKDLKMKVNSLVHIELN